MRNDDDTLAIAIIVAKGCLCEIGRVAARLACTQLNALWDHIVLTRWLLKQPSIGTDVNINVLILRFEKMPL